MLIAEINPEIPSPKTTSPKNGKAQIISLAPLPNGRISISDRKTRTSVPSAKIPVIKQKYVFINLLTASPSSFMFAGDTPKSGVLDYQIGA